MVAVFGDKNIDRSFTNSHNFIPNITNYKDFHRST